MIKQLSKVKCSEIISFFAVKCPQRVLSIYKIKAEATVVRSGAWDCQSVTSCLERKSKMDIFASLVLSFHWLTAAWESIWTLPSGGCHNGPPRRPNNTKTKPSRVHDTNIAKSNADPRHWDFKLLFGKQIQYLQRQYINQWCDNINSFAAQTQCIVVLVLESKWVDLPSWMLIKSPPPPLNYICGRLPDYYERLRNLPRKKSGPDPRGFLCLQKSDIAPKFIFYICCIFLNWKVSFEKLVQSESRHSVKVLLVKVLLKQVHNFVTILRAHSKFRDCGLNSLEESATNWWKSVRNSTDHIWCQ